jgi:putative flippase GtrA
MSPIKTSDGTPMNSAAPGDPRRALVRQLVRFGIVGVVNTATTLATIWLLTRLLHVPVWTASAVGYAVGTVQSYVLNRLWTFSDTERVKVAPQAATFVGVNVVCGLIFSTINAALSRTMVLALATLLTMVVVVPLSFILNRWLVFRSTARGASDAG